jgi:tight adherence protein C
MFFFNLDFLSVLIVLAILIGIAGITLLIIGLVRINKSADTVSRRMQEFVENQDKSAHVRPTYRLLPRELSGSFFNRTIKPFFERIVDYFGRFTPTNSIAILDHQLMVAGNPLGMHAQQFYGVRVLSLFLGIFIAFLLNYRNPSLDILMIILGILIIILGLYLPRLWLDSRIRQRKDELRRNLPDALDMFSVCVSAGLGFDQSLKKIIDYWPTDLSAEFRRVVQEMEMGVSRADALRNMAARIEVEEISSFIAIIIQAESIGMSFSEVLHNQAKQMRILRQFRAKELANSLPAKMVIPLAIFIFPALIAVIVGPLVPTIMSIFS